MRSFRCCALSLLKTMIGGCVHCSPMVDFSSSSWIALLNPQKKRANGNLRSRMQSWHLRITLNWVRLVDARCLCRCPSRLTVCVHACRCGDTREAPSPLAQGSLRWCCSAVDGSRCSISRLYFLCWDWRVAWVWKCSYSLRLFRCALQRQIVAVILITFQKQCSRQPISQVVFPNPLGPLTT